MHIAILTRNSSLYSHRRLAEAAHGRGHDVDFIDTLGVLIDISADHPTMHYRGALLPHYDAVIPRIGASITTYGAAVVRQFEMMGTPTLATSAAIVRSRDKLHSLQALIRKGIDLPKTAFADSAKGADTLIRVVGGPPVVIKLLEGTQGLGVILAETLNSARSIIEAFCASKVNILIQEFIADSAGRDIRCLVVGDQVVAAMERQGTSGDFRANLHRGGRAVAIPVEERLHRLAVAATRAMGLQVAGVDLLRAARGPVVIEVNSSPGLEGIEKATAVDVAGAIIAHLERLVSPALAIEVAANAPEAPRPPLAAAS